MAKILYLSYDGMTDPLGESQVLPYVVGLADRGHDFHLVSFEKADPFALHGERMRTGLEEHGVVWHPLDFTARPRLLAKAWDLFRFRTTVARLQREVGFDLVHCRSYVSAGLGLELSERFGVPYLFDMRGFWVDERTEGGIWNDALPHYRMLYRYYKRKEKRLLDGAAGVVSLTHAAVDVLRKAGHLPSSQPVDVIPCCVDTSVFSAAVDPTIGRREVRERLDIGADDPVLVYLGSIGTWYMLPEMMRLFGRIVELAPDSKFLFITRHDHAELEAAARTEGVPAGSLRIVSAIRSEVPTLLSAADASVFFIRPTFSKTASCPTKLGELMAMGVPVVCNAGVGDVDRIVLDHQAGLVLPDVEDTTLVEAAPRVLDLRTFPSGPIVAGAERLFSLKGGLEQYAELYDRILSEA